MARIKPNPYIIADRAQCEGALAEMAALDRKLSTIENDMQEAVDAAKSKASQLAGPLQARRKGTLGRRGGLCQAEPAGSVREKTKVWTWASGLSASGPPRRSSSCVV